ncbi:N-acetylmuramoyl-L-alanine amidase [Wenzhouxiangella sediminis]|nr:N-acetylmuramoyl-L-alanine amidase [Wenzhouxiangella sediminis]
MTTTMPNADYNPLSYVDRLDERDVDSIELVVIHATELPDLETAREYGERIHYRNSQTGNSGHFYIDRDGSVEQWVPLERVAHHVRGYNKKSIGIELVNRGRWPDWLHSRRQDWPEDYSEAQIEALAELLHKLKTRLPNLDYIAGHDELDPGVVDASDNPAIKVRRKVDPGPLFPWGEIEAVVDLKRSGTKIL